MNGVSLAAGTLRDDRIMIKSAPLRAYQKRDERNITYWILVHPEFFFAKIGKTVNRHASCQMFHAIYLTLFSVGVPFELEFGRSYSRFCTLNSHHERSRHMCPIFLFLVLALDVTHFMKSPQHMQRGKESRHLLDF